MDRYPDRSPGIPGGGGYIDDIEDEDSTDDFADDFADDDLDDLDDDDLSLDFDEEDEAPADPV